MSRIALFDLREEELSIFIFEKKGPALIARHSVPFLPGGDYSFRLEEKLTDIDEAYLSLPLSLLNFRILELPSFDMKKVLELVPFELDGLILGGTGDIVFDAYPLMRDEGRSKVLVAYIRKEMLRALLNNMKSYGIDPRAVLSLELGHALSVASRNGSTDHILNPEAIENDDRLSVAIKEIQAPTLDFRKGELAYTADTEKIRKSLRLTATLVVLLLLLFLAGTTRSLVSATRDNQALKDNIRKTYQALFPAEKRISNEVYQLKAHIKELQDKESSFIGSSPLKVLYALTRISSPDVSLSEVTVEKEIIILKGECSSLSDAQRIKNELDEILDGVSITDTKPSSRNKTFFTITAKGIKK